MHGIKQVVSEQRRASIERAYDFRLETSNEYFHDALKLIRSIKNDFKTRSPTRQGRLLNTSRGRLIYKTRDGG
jgi:hypothetical protein